jgi:phospholipase/carboxylesterase
VLDSIEIETAPNPRWTVLWLHGLGADGRDFEPIVPQLVAPDWPAIRFIFPHAPVRAVTVNGGMRMRAWYDILGLEIANRQDEPGIRDSIRHVERLIDRESMRGVDESRLILAGFSQGGAIALAAGVRHRRALGGIVARWPASSRCRPTCRWATVPKPNCTRRTAPPRSGSVMAMPIRWSRPA